MPVVYRLHNVTAISQHVLKAFTVICIISCISTDSHVEPHRQLLNAPATIHTLTRKYNTQKESYGASTSEKLPKDARLGRI